MTYQNFCSLPKDTQRAFVKKDGVFLFGRTTLHGYVSLYQVYGFYVELYYDTRLSYVALLKAFEDTNQLAPYLELVDVQDVAQLLW